MSERLSVNGHGCHTALHFSIKDKENQDKISKGAKIRNRYNQESHLTQNTNGKVTNSQLDTTKDSQEVSPFPAGDHKVSKGAKIRYRYNQVPYLTQDTNGKVTNSQLDTTQESQEVSPFPAGAHKAHIDRRAQRHSKNKSEQKQFRLKDLSIDEMVGPDAFAVCRATRGYLFDFFCPGIQFNLLLSPYLCFIYL